MQSTFGLQHQRAFLTLFSMIVMALIIIHSTDIAALLLIVELAAKMEYVSAKEEEKKMRKSDMGFENVDYRN